MSVIRVNKTANYTVMSNTHLRDRSISLKAKGLMSQMLSLPDDWDYSIAGLAAINAEKESSIKTALDELKKAGYLVVTKMMPDKTESGRIEYIYDLFEEPRAEKQEAEKQGIENLGVEIQGIENQGQINKEESITEKRNKEDNTKQVSKKTESFDDILDSSPLISNNPELRESCQEFIKMRKLIKKPLTNAALKMAINKAYQLAGGDPETIKKIIDQSVMNSWQGVFPLRDDDVQKKPVTKKASGSSYNPFTALREEEGIA